MLDFFLEILPFHVSFYSLLICFQFIFDDTVTFVQVYFVFEVVSKLASIFAALLTTMEMASVNSFMPVEAKTV